MIKDPLHTLNAAQFTLVAFLAATSLHLSASDEPQDSTFSSSVMWDSKYVSEGRDNFESGGLFSVSATYDLPNISLELWLADAEDNSYDELNLSVAYTQEIHGAAVYIAYTRLEFMDDSESDNELAAGLSFPLINSLTSSLDYVYSTEAEGSFVDISLRGEYALTGEKLTISPFLTQSFDFGYATDQHDGANNFQAGIEFGLSISDRLELFGYLAHSWAQEDVKRDEGGDISWGGLGLAIAF